MKTEDTKHQDVNEGYEKPAIEIIEMETEGSILAGSGDDFGGGGGWGN